MENLQRKIKLFLISTLILCCVLSFSNMVYAVDSSAYDGNGTYNQTAYPKANDIVYWQKPADWSGNVTISFGHNYWGTINYDSTDSMTQVEENLYMYKFPSDNTNCTHLKFSAGSQEITNLDFICSGYIYEGNTSKEKIDLSRMYSVTNGDTIYFKRPSSWSYSQKIRIYLYWDYSGSDQYTSWEGRPEMTQVSGTDIYSYTLACDSGRNFNKVIFTTEENTGAKQTINLETLLSGVIFKADEAPEESGNYNGTWIQYDKSGLNTVIQKAKTISNADKEYYTEESWNMFEEQLELAETIYSSDVKATFTDFSSQYDKSILALQFAYDNLKLNTKILEDKIAEMKDVETDIYTENSVNNFNNSIKEAEEALENSSDLTVSKMKMLIQKMEDAYNKLKEKADKSELEKAIEKAEGIDSDLYTEDSVKDLKEALEEAKKVYEDPNATDEQVKEQTDKLNQAIENLKEKEKTVLGNDTQNDDGSENVPVKKDDNTKNDDESGNPLSTAVQGPLGTAVQGIVNTLNPFTGDTIYVYITIVVAASIVYIITRKYLKKQKDNEK